MSDRYFRVRWEKRGRHVHCRVFSAPHPRATYAKLGDLVLDEDDWERKEHLFNGRVCEILPEGATP